MKEIHKLLLEKLKPLFREKGFLKGNDLKWYKPMNGFSVGLELQKSQWSDEIYMNYCIFIHDSKKFKPKVTDPILFGRIAGPYLGISNEVYNEALDLSHGNVFEKTNKIISFVQEATKLLNRIDNLKSVIYFYKTGKIEGLDNYTLLPMSQNDVEKALGI